MINRRELLKTAALTLPLIPIAKAQELARKTNGLPPLKIEDVKVITTNGGSHYHWVFLKIITSEPGLYGIGSANDDYQAMAVVADLEDHLKPWLIGKDPDRIEELWREAQFRTYWRNGPINNNVLSAMDVALWDIKGKRAGMPVYELLGGKVRDAVAAYDHQGGNTKEACLDSLQKSMANGFSHIRIQLGATVAVATSPEVRAVVPRMAMRGRHLTKSSMSRSFLSCLSTSGPRAGFGPKLIHDVHSHMTGMNAVELARRLEPVQMFYVEDILPPEQLFYYKNIRENCTTPQAVGELFTHPLEAMPLIKDNLIDSCAIALRRLVASRRCASMLHSAKSAASKPPSRKAERTIR
jgi:mannonate dehydratase